MMWKGSEARLLPQFNILKGPTRCETKRFVLSSTWVACCVLLVILLLGEFQYWPAAHPKTLKLGIPSDFKQYTRYLRQDRAISSTDLMVSLQHNNSSSTSSAGTAEVSLDALWTEIPFTTVVKATGTQHEYETSDHDAWQQQPGAHFDQASAGTAQQRVLQPEQQHNVGSLTFPKLSYAHDHNIALLVRYAQEAVKHTVTAQEARSGYATAFERVVPLHTDSPWHATTTAAVRQQPQQMGTTFEAPASAAGGGTQTGSSSSSSGEDEPAPGDSDNPQQQLSRSHQSTAAAQQLMTLALVMLKSTRQLVHCGTEDSSMPPPQPVKPGGAPGGRVLLAAVLSNQGSTAADGAAGFSAAGDAMPNFVLQVVMFAMQSQPGALFVSIVHDSSSSSSANNVGSSSSSNNKGVLYWLDVLKLLLLPLRVPLLVTDAAEVLLEETTGKQASGIQYEAALRNSAINRFFSDPAENCSSSSSRSTGSKGTNASSEYQEASSSIASAREEPDSEVNLDGSSGFTGSSNEQSVSAVRQPAGPEVPQQQQQQHSPAGIGPPSVAVTTLNRDSDSSSTSSYTTSESTSHSSATDSNGPSAQQLAACFQPDWVLFIDSGVLFCKADLHRLLMHRHADVACGWDLRMAEPTAAAAAAAPPPTSPIAAAALGSAPIVPAAATAAPITVGPDGNPSAAAMSEVVSFMGTSSSARAAGVATAAAAELASAAAVPGGVSSVGSAVGPLIGLAGPQVEATGQDVTPLLAALSSSSSGSSVPVTTAPTPLTISNGLEKAAAAATAAGGGEQAFSGSGIERRLQQEQVVQFGVLDPGQIQQQQQQIQVLQQHGGVWPNSAATITSSSSNAGHTGTVLQDNLQLQQSSTGIVAAATTAQLLLQHRQPSVQQLPSNKTLLPASHQLSHLQQQQQQHTSAPGRPHLSILNEFPFYYGDAAVGRLVTGQQFDVVPPYAATHMPTQSRLAAGLPMQVYCCWSGLAKFAAKPFRRGLRFRSRQLGECKTTPQNLICDDLHRLGFSKVLADPGVLVTRQLGLSARISNSVKQAERMPYIRRSRWLEVQGSGSPWLLSQQQLRDWTYNSVVCCDKSSNEVRQTQGLQTDRATLHDARSWGSTGDLNIFSSDVQSSGTSSIAGNHGLATIKPSSTALSSGGAIKFISSLYFGAAAADTQGMYGTSAADIPYPSRSLSVGDFVTAAEALPVAAATVRQVQAVARLRAAGSGAGAVAAAADVQQCGLVDVMARNFTEGFLWQVKQKQQLQHQ